MLQISAAEDAAAEPAPSHTLASANFAPVARMHGRRIACILSPARLWLLQEAAECCPEGPIKQEIVRALREVSVKMMPSVKSAKLTIANAN
eukprot:COSAG06_NODE_10427_length_1683_cov_1.270833_2_plen_91_part_00